MVNWTRNGELLGLDMLYVVLWVAAWGIIDGAVFHFTVTEKERDSLPPKKRWLVYVGLLVVTAVVLLVVPRE